MFPPVPAPKSNIKEFFVTINYEVILKVLMPCHICPGLGPQGSVTGSFVFHVTRQGLYPGGQVPSGCFCHSALQLLVLIYAHYSLWILQRSYSVMSVLTSQTWTFIFYHPALITQTLGNSFNPMGPDFHFCTVRGTDAMVQWPVYLWRSNNQCFYTWVPQSVKFFRGIFPSSLV